MRGKDSLQLKMVSFICDHCQDTIKKAKVKFHMSKCRFYSLSCVDCNGSFNSKNYNSHVSCMTESKKYGGGLAKERITLHSTIKEIQIPEKILKKESETKQERTMRKAANKLRKEQKKLKKQQSKSVNK